MTLKVFTFVRRAAGLTPEEFQDRWPKWHVEHIAETNELRRHVAGCELNLRLAADYQRPRGRGEVDDSGFDGVEVLWFESLEDLESFRAEPAFDEALNALASVADPGRALAVVTHEPDIINETGRRSEAGVKLVCIFRRSASLNLPEFHRHWLEHHGGLFQDVDELNQFLLAYDQNHSILVPGLEFDGVTEQWYRSLDTYAEIAATAAHHELVEPDVAYFLDPASIHFILAGPPTVIIDRG